MGLRSYRWPLTLGIGASFVGVRVASRWAGGATELARFIPLRCPLKALLGVPCPTCGLGRSLCHALALDWSGATLLQPGGPVLVAIAIVLGAAAWFAPQQTEQCLRRARDWLAARPQTLWLALVSYAAWGFSR